jgi:hypothetical protein
MPFGVDGLMWIALVRLAPEVKRIGIAGFILMVCYRRGRIR